MIKIAYDIKIYRDILKNMIRDDDVVIELGSHVGNTTKIITELTNDEIISIDNSPEAVEPMENLSKKYKNLKFISGDVRIHDILIDVAKDIGGCDVLSIDLGGGYHPDTTFKVYFIWASTLKPRDCIIRNKGLIDFVNSSKTSEPFYSNKGYLDSTKNAGVPPQLKEFSLWSNKLK